MAHRIAVVGLTSRVAQYPYCPFQGVWSVIVRFASFLKAQELIDENLHTLRTFLRFVQNDIAPLE